MHAISKFLITLSSGSDSMQQSSILLLYVVSQDWQNKELNYFNIEGSRKTLTVTQLLP